MKVRLLALLSTIVIFSLGVTNSFAQSTNYPFTSGPIPCNDTSYFTCQISGLYTLAPPGTTPSSWYYSLNNLQINITTDHPEGLMITLTSPQGTTLLLSAFNGAGGSNYTQCNFDYSGGPSITTGSAPFTGTWQPQGPGGFSVFDWENPNGTWTITVIDTMNCGGGGGGGGGSSPSPGWFNGAGSGQGGFAIGFSSYPPPCLGWIPDNTVTVCPGTPVDILSYYAGFPYNIGVFDGAWSWVSNPSAVTVAGTYNIEAYDPWDGCFYYAIYTINNYPGSSIGPDANVNVCPGSPANLPSYFSLGAMVSTVWWINGGTITTAQATLTSSPGVYMVVGTSSQGCNDTAFANVTNSSAPSLGPDAVDSTCAGNSFNLNSVFTTTGLTTSWTFSGSAVPNPSSVTTPGVYQLIASNASGCADTALFTLNSIAGASLGPDQNVSGCITGAYNLLPLFNTTGLNTAWTLNGNPVANPAAVVINGTYILVGTAPNGCTDTARVILNVSQKPNIGPDQTQNICSGGTVNLTTLYSTAPHTPQWYFGGTPFATPTTAANGGVYTLIVTALNGCTDTAQVTLNVQPAPALGPDQFHAICTNGTIDLTSLYTTTGYTTSWTYNGTAVANPAAATTTGTYTLVASAGASCTDTALVTIAYTATPSLGPNAVVDICTGTSANLTTVFNTTGFTPSWTYNGNPVANPSSVNNAGVYTLIASGSSGCTDTALLTLNVLPAPSLGPDQAQSICSNSSIDLTALYTTTGFTASWTSGGIPVTNPSAVNSAGTYVLIASNAGSCTDTAQFILTVLTTPTLGPDAVTGICSGNSANLTTVFNTTGYTTSWTQGGTPVANPGNITVAGTYTLIATAPSGCSDTANVAVNVGTTPSLGIDQSLTQCDGSAVNLNSLFTTTGLTTAWTQNGVAVTSPNAVTNGGNYMLVATNASGCSDTAYASITFNPSPDLGADQNKGICAGAPADLTTGFSLTGLTAIWTLNGAPVPDPSNVTAGGNYQLIATNAFGCSDTAMVTVTVTNGPSLGPDQTFDLCPWQTVDLSTAFNTSGLTATYTFNGSAIANYTAVYDSGTYTVLVTDLNGCTDDAFAFVNNVICICSADFVHDAKCIQEPVTFTIITDSVLTAAHWTFGNGQPDQYTLQPTIMLNSEDSILVKLEATMTCGTYTVQKYITAYDCSDSCHFYMPTAFTPNSDGTNDSFVWKGECTPEEFYLAVYNRFGQVVFRSDNPLASWDGKYNNTTSPSGVYVYHLEYRLPYQMKQVVSGKLNVIR